MHSASYNTLKRHWNNGWDDVDYRKYTYCVFRFFGLMETESWLSKSDWNAMESAFGVDVSCKKLAAAYNEYFASKGGCYKFSCSRISTSPYEITLKQDIPGGQE